MKPLHGSICVLDDDVSVLKSIRRLFLVSGLGTETFHDPESFLDYAKSHPVALAILDVRLPGSMSGLDVQLQLHDMHPETPVIIMTASTELGIEDRAIGNGAFRFFVKPFESELFVAVAKEAMGQFPEP